MRSDEHETTEISIARDGRVFAFGTSREVLEILAGLNPDDRGLARRVALLGEQENHVGVPAGEPGKDD